VLFQQPSVGGTGGFSASTTQRTDFVPEGVTGEELVIASARKDLEVSAENGRSGEIIFKHGKFTEPGVTCYATLNQLALDEKKLGEPRVHTYLWSGSKFNDFTVPRDKLELGLTTMKKQEWQKQDEGLDMYTTTNKAFQSPVVGQYTKRDTIKPAAEGGQAAQVGRKATGEMCKSLESTHLETGLRGEIKLKS